MSCNCNLAGTDACIGCPKNPKYEPDWSKIKINIVGRHNKTKGFPVIQYWCSQCDALLNKYDKYCHNCGIEIDWEMMTD